MEIESITTANNINGIDYNAIILTDGTMRMVRKGYKSPIHDPLNSDEMIIDALCKYIEKINNKTS